MTSASEKFLTTFTAILSIGAMATVAWAAFRDTPVRPASSPHMESTTLRQMRFTSQQEQLRQSVITSCTPRLLGSSDDDRQAAIAMVFALYPNDAKAILQSVAASLPPDGSTRRQLHEAVLRADAVAQQTGEWAVVLSNHATLADAQSVVRGTQGMASTPIEIYRKDNRFNTVAVGFPTRYDAESAAIALRDRVQDTAFVVNLKAWCPQRTCPERGYYDCGK